MSLANFKLLLVVLLLSVMQETFSKKALLRKSLAAPTNSTGPITDFSAFWNTHKVWSAIMTESRTLAGQIRSDLAVNGTTPVQSWEREMTALFKQNPSFSDERFVKFWIVKTNGYEGNNVNQREAEIDLQNGLISLNFFAMTNQTYVVGESKYAEKVKELAQRLADTNNSWLKLTQDYFALADTNNSGDVSPDEFRAAFGPIIPAGTNVEKLFKDFDFNENGTLSQEEIGHVLGKILELNIKGFYRPQM